MATTRIQALIQERADLVAEGSAIFEQAEKDGRELTAAECARDDAINARLEEIAGDLAREQKRQAREQTVGRGESRPAVAWESAPSVRYNAAGKVVDERGAPIELNATGLPRLIPVATARQAATFESGRDLSSLKPWGADTGFPLGEYLFAVHAAGTGRGTDPRLLYQAAGQGANETNGADGGFLVPRVVADEIMMRMFGGEILSRARRRTLTVGNSIELNVIDETSRATGSRHGGVQSYWVDEGTAPGASRPKFARTEWKPKKLATLGYATDELLADASMIESTMFDAFVDDQMFMWEDSVVGGSGAGKPQGLLNSPALISVPKETGQAAATVVKENIDKMWARLHAKQRAGAVWLVNQDTEPQLDNMQMVIGTGGTPVYLPPGGISDTPWARLKGRPVIPVEYCPTLGTVGDIILVNLSQYLLIDKGEPTRATSMHVAFTTDETAFRVTSRVDGHLTWKSAITPFKGSNSQGPVVALATRA